jgi:hypothetical protein
VSIVKNIVPNIIPYADDVSGESHVKLDKVLYSTLDVAKLWFEKLLASIVFYRLISTFHVNK